MFVGTRPGNESIPRPSCHNTSPAVGVCIARDCQILVFLSFGELTGAGGSTSSSRDDDDPILIANQ